jgi:hypothetical protein
LIFNACQLSERHGRHHYTFTASQLLQGFSDIEGDSLSVVNPNDQQWQS